MGINKLKVVLTEEAQAFLDAQPLKEIAKAEEIRKAYFNNKKKQHYGTDEIDTCGQYER